MADFLSCTAADLSDRAATLFTALAADTDALTDLAPYEIEAGDEIARGLALVEAFRAAVGTQAAEKAEAVTATGVAALALAEVEAFYVRHRKLGRAAHRRDTPAYRALGLAGDVPEADAEMLDEAETFYRAVETTPALAEGVRGLNTAAVAAGLARVEAARTARAAQVRESGEAQTATTVRQSAEAQLRALAADVSAAVEDAYHDQPQRREAFGLFERGTRWSHWKRRCP